MDIELYPMPVESLIRKSFPEEADRDHRICLLRLYHAVERADSKLDAIGFFISDYLRDPEPLYSGRLLTGGARGLAEELEGLAREIRKSLADLPRFARDTYTTRQAAGVAGV